MTLVKLINFLGGGKYCLLKIAIASSVFDVSGLDKSKKFALLAVSAGAMLFLSILESSTVQAAIININSKINSEANPIVQSFTAGAYQVEYIGVAQGGTYNAWNAWGGSVSGCDVNGKNCLNGWLNGYRIKSSEFGTISINDMTYQTAALALIYGQNTSFTLTINSNVNFFIYDAVFSDNVGGVSLSVTPLSSIPEPSSILGLLTFGILGIGTTLMRKVNR